MNPSLDRTFTAFEDWVAEVARGYAPKIVLDHASKVPPRSQPASLEGLKETRRSLRY